VKNKFKFFKFKVLKNSHKILKIFKFKNWQEDLEFINLKLNLSPFYQRYIKTKAF